MSSFTFSEMKLQIFIVALQILFFVSLSLSNPIEKSLAADAKQENENSTPTVIITSDDVDADTLRRGGGSGVRPGGSRPIGSPGSAGGPGRGGATADNISFVLLGTCFFLLLMNLNDQILSAVSQF